RPARAEERMVLALARRPCRGDGGAQRRIGDFRGEALDLSLPLEPRPLEQEPEKPPLRGEANAVGDARASARVRRPPAIRPRRAHGATSMRSGTQPVRIFRAPTS